MKKKIMKWKVFASVAIAATCFIAIACNEQLIDEFERSTISQTNEMPSEVYSQQQRYLKEHPGAKLTYMEGTGQDVDNFVNNADVKGKVVYVYSYTRDNKKGVLLTDVVAHAEALQNDDRVFMVVEKQPEFVGGMDALREFLQSNIRYPTTSLEKGENGTVYISMVINEDGRVSDAKVLKGVSAAIDAEALRVINGMPSWIPGTQNGKRVKVRYNVPIKFNPAHKDGEYYEVERPKIGALTEEPSKMKVSTLQKSEGPKGKTVSGTVVDEVGNPLAGLNVIVAGTTTGATTDSQGRFSLVTGQQNGKLVFSFIGFETITEEF